MKKLTTIFLATTPALGFSQVYTDSPGSSAGGIVMFLIGLAFFLLIFLVLRQVVLWYWKIDTIIKNQQEQIQAQRTTNILLDEFIKELRNRNN